jgi:hypothetical protein
MSVECSSTEQVLPPNPPDPLHAALFLLVLTAVYNINITYAVSSLPPSLLEEVFRRERIYRFCS